MNIYIFLKRSFIRSLLFPLLILINLSCGKQIQYDEAVEFLDAHQDELDSIVCIMNNENNIGGIFRRDYNDFIENILLAFEDRLSYSIEDTNFSDQTWLMIPNNLRDDEEEFWKRDYANILLYEKKKRSLEDYLNGHNIRKESFDILRRFLKDYGLYGIAKYRDGINIMICMKEGSGLIYSYDTLQPYPFLAQYDYTQIHIRGNWYYFIEERSEEDRLL